MSGTRGSNCCRHLVLTRSREDGWEELSACTRVGIIPTIADKLCFWGASVNREMRPDLYSLVSSFWHMFLFLIVLEVSNQPPYLRSCDVINVISILNIYIIMLLSAKSEMIRPFSSHRVHSNTTYPPLPPHPHLPVML